MFYLYILESLKDSTFYVGQTNNIVDSVKRHNAGRIASTKSKRPYAIVYFEEFQSRSEAMFREWKIKKKYNTERKRRLISLFDQNKLNQFLGL